MNFLYFNHTFSHSPSPTLGVATRIVSLPCTIFFNQKQSMLMLFLFLLLYKT